MLNYIIVLGLFQAILTALFLYSNKLRKSTDTFLFVLVLCIVVHLSIKFIIYHFVDEPNVRKAMNTFIGFFYTPIVYLLARNEAKRKQNMISNWYLFVPILIVTIGFFSTATVLYAAPAEGIRVLQLYNLATTLTFMPFAIILSAKTLYFTYRNLSPSATRILITRISSILLTLNCIGLVYYSIGNHDRYHQDLFIRSIAYASLAIICILIGQYKFKSMAHEHIIPKVQVDLNPDNACHEESETEHTVVHKMNQKERKEILTKERMAEIWNKLETGMKSDRYYKDSELTLEKLSQLVKENKYYISETLNNYANKPFYTYINEYRILDIKGKIERYATNELDINMLTIAYSAGFNSKSSFNKYFKEMTGLTPTHYFKMLSPDKAI
ncbi:MULTISPECIES: helix-turn-helix domain-containing protein [unclassified Sphingobacterium]|uniref:helix-turn-helix domain-containing protein n=1 Tax=unclassified Sphingobacterium TaxID=2609468 RepID=UPI0026005DF9|nr:helix-turn-helix domain-containing protein [Sphingobacterium sp. UBA5670]